MNPFVVTKDSDIALSLVTRPFSLNQLGRPSKHLRRNRNADLLRRLEIDHQLELRRLLHRQIGGLGALQDFVYIPGYKPIAVHEVRPVRHESTSIYIFSSTVYRR